MWKTIRKPWAFFRKDFISSASYRMAFVGQILGVLVVSTSFFFLSELFAPLRSTHLAPYGGDYFSFVLIGVAFSSYLQVSLQGFSTSVREAQTLGTLEALLVTQTEIPTIILSSSIFSFAMTSLRVLFFLLAGVLVFGTRLDHGGLAAAAVVLMLTVVAFSSLGILSASFVMVFKRGDPVCWFFMNLSWLLGGVYYPITILPEWLQKLSYALPITYALEGMRLALLRGKGIVELLPTILPLAIFCLVMVPASLLVFQRAVTISKRDGSLTQY
jgi:ABC-2 type transport system permease protein